MEARDLKAIVSFKMWYADYTLGVESGQQRSRASPASCLENFLGLLLPLNPTTIFLKREREKALLQVSVNEINHTT